MNQIDYTHEIALCARNVAESFEEEAFESVEGDRSEDAVKHSIISAVESEAAFSAFEGEMDGPGLGSNFSMESAEEAMLLGEIAYYSLPTFPDAVASSASKRALRNVAYEAVKSDIKHCTFSEMRTRVKNYKKSRGMPH